jgi:hypothetical protein
VVDEELPERTTLRFWPWLVMCVVGVLAFTGLAYIAFYVATGAASMTARVIGALVGAGLLALIGYMLASLRTRSVLDRQGGTAISAFGRQRVDWAEVERLDTIHALPGWAIRAWHGNDETTIVYICHDTHGRRPRAASYDSPPLDTAPPALIKGYTLATRYWREARRD